MKLLLIKLTHAGACKLAICGEDFKVLLTCGHSLYYKSLYCKNLINCAIYYINIIYTPGKEPPVF